MPSLAEIRLRACKLWPYGSHAILSLVPVERPGLGTLAVDKHWRLYYDPRILADEPLDESAGVILHEISHLLLKHHRRGERFVPANSDDGLWTLWNVAADYAINSMLREERIPLWDGSLCPVQDGFPACLSAEEYFRRLMDKRDEERRESEEQAEQQAQGEPSEGADETSGESSDEESDSRPDDDDTGSDQPPDDTDDSEDEGAEGDDSPNDSDSADDSPNQSDESSVESAGDQSNGSLGDGSDDSSGDNSRDSVGESDSANTDEGSPGKVLNSFRIRDGIQVITGDVRAVTAARVFDPRQVKLAGGGGTDMGALIQEAAKGRPQPQLIVVATDGVTPWCERVRIPVVACLTRKEQRSQVPDWIKTVVLEESQAAG